MSAPADQPQPYSRFIGRRATKASAPAPVKLALDLRKYAISAGLTIVKVSRSRVRASGSFHLEMADAKGRRWNMRVSDHLRPRQTGHAMPHVELVTFDGLSGLEVGRELIDKIVAGEVPWFDPTPTVRCLQPAKMRKGKRRCRA